MEREESSKTTVIFKKTKDNEVVAFFPYCEVNRYNIMSYMHLGQHGEASMEFYNSCRKAQPEEYKPLYDELKNVVGYDLEPKTRINYSKLTSYWR